MSTPPLLSPDEPLRLQALRSLNIIETPLEERFERITRLAKRILEVDIAAVSLTEASRQWIKSAQGYNKCEIPRDTSFTGHAILQDNVFVVPDARLDPRFFDNPLVTGAPQIVFYAGCPLKSKDGFSIGALCVCNSKPRELGERDLQTLRDLAALVEAELRSSCKVASLADVSVEARRGLIDGLTRMWNREGILKLGQNYLRRARAIPCGLASITVKLDHFDAITMQCGPAAADEVLRISARRILGAIRESDSLGRLGEAEFLILFPNCASEGVVQEAAERVRVQLSGTPVDTHAMSVPLSAIMRLRFIGPDSLETIEEVVEQHKSCLAENKA